MPNTYNSKNENLFKYDIKKTIDTIIHHFSWLHLLTFVGVIFGGYITYYQLPPVDPKHPSNAIYYSIFWSTCSILVTAYISSIIYALSTEQKEKKLNDTILDILQKTNENIQRINDRTNEIKVFKHSYDGLEYCIRTIPSASRVINTVLRHGKDKSLPGLGSKEWIYKQWVDVKQKHLQDDTYTLTELVSSHFTIDDGAREFINTNHKNPKYNYKFIDDNHYAMIQFTLFDFDDQARNKEVVFGWEFPNMEHGPCFKTNNKAVVDFFENYFFYYYNNNKTQNNPSIIRSSIIDKCYHSLKPGVWLYLLEHDFLNNIFGVITIADTGDENIKNKYKATANVNYFGNDTPVRGTWYSINFDYEPLTQAIHIQYDITLDKLSDGEIEKSLQKKYTGYLHFVISDKINTVFHGQFKDLSKQRPSGDIKIAPCLDRNKKIIPDISDINLQEAFKRIFGEDIKQEKPQKRQVKIT